MDLQLTTSGQPAKFAKGLFQTDLIDLVKGVDKLTYRKSPRPVNHFESLRLFVEQICTSAIPGVLPYSFKDGRRVYHHYAVTVGAGATQLFLMDPGIDAHKGSLYNNCIQADEDGNLCDAFNREVVKLRTCLAISRKGFRFPQKWWLPSKLTQEVGTADNGL